MQFVCYICHTDLPTINTVTRHLRSDHALFPSSNLTLKCCVPVCLLAFKTYSGLRKHLVKHMQIRDDKIQGPPLEQMKVSANSSDLKQTAIELLADPENLLSETNCDFDSDASSRGSQCDDGNSLVELDDPNESISSLEEDNDNLLDAAPLVTSAQYILKLESTGMAKSLVQTVVESTTEVLNDVVDKVLAFLNENDVGDDAKLRVYLNEQKQQFAQFSSKYKRENFYSNLGDYVKPVELSIGTRYDQIFDKSENIYKTVPLPCTFMYIPILQTLKFILQNDDVMKMLLSDRQELEGILKDIHDGSYYRSHPFFNQIMQTLELQIFYDEFEVTNPLGSKTNAHKLGAIYFIIRNLPPEFNSKLQNIHLVALFYVPDLKTCGFDEVLKPIVRDIILLETEGIKIENAIIRGTVIALSFDNLGGNIILGMVESFSASHFCRMCIASKEETRIMSKEKINLLRTKASYEQNCRNLSEKSVHVLGIKTRSILNNLQHFNTIDSMSVDIMHDILEGVAQYEIKLFLIFIVDVLKLIKLHELNERIRAFNYGNIDVKDKPSPIVLDKPGVLIGQRAAQTWCLARYLPLIIGDLVQPTCAKYDLLKQKWRVITLLLQCMDIIFSPVVTIAMIAELRLLIEQHHNLFRIEFERHLIPKHHFMLHYPTVIERMGPLIFLWSMRFEGKHNYFKDLARKYCNFKNVAKTLANQHQRYMYFHWKVSTKELNTVLYPGPGKFGMYQNLVTEFSLQNSGTKLPLSAKVLVTNQVKFHHIYKTGFFVVSCLDKLSNLPIFQMIEKIFIHENVAFAVCKTWKTTGFNGHCHAFAISAGTENGFFLINLSLLEHQTAYERHQSFNAVDYYIVPRYRIM